MVPALAQSSAPKAKRLGFIYMPNGVAQELRRHRLLDAEDHRQELRAVADPDAARSVSETSSRSSAASRTIKPTPRTTAPTATTRARRARGSPARAAKRTEGADVENGITADQIAASVLGKDTPLPSLELAIDLNFLSGQCENSYACIYMNTIAWRSPTSPLPTENNPRLVFERLFGNGGTTAQRVALAQENRSILDSVTADFSRLSRDARPDRSHARRQLPRIRARGRAAHRRRRET